jgi:hypothetical protein
VAVMCIVLLVIVGGFLIKLYGLYLIIKLKLQFNFGWFHSKLDKRKELNKLWWVIDPTSLISLPRRKLSIDMLRSRIEKKIWKSRSPE